MLNPFMCKKTVFISDILLFWFSCNTENMSVSLKLFNICLLFCKNLNGFGWHDIQFYHSVAVLTVTLGQCHQTSVNGWNKPDACYRNVCQWKKQLRKHQCYSSSSENTKASSIFHQRTAILFCVVLFPAFFIIELSYDTMLYYSLFNSQS